MKKQVKFKDIEDELLVVTSYDNDIYLEVVTDEGSLILEFKRNAWEEIVESLKGV